MIVHYTAGVPPAVNALLVCIRLLDQPNPNELITAVWRVCSSGLSLLTPKDEAIFRRCIEFSWCGIELNNHSAIDDEPITSIMARLGLFRGPADSSERFTIVVPHYLLEYYSNFPSINSMMAIANQDTA